MSRVTREEGWAFIKAVLEAFPSATWTVFDGEGRAVATSAARIAQ